MNVSKLLPGILALMFAMSALLLWISGTFNWTYIAAACVVVSLTFAVAILLSLTMSSILLATGWFPVYWESGYPPLHGVMNLAYGIMYLPVGLLYFLIAMGAVAVGFVIGNSISMALDRYVPGIAIALFLVLGQFLAGSISAIVMLFCGGLIISTWMKRRVQQRT